MLQCNESVPLLINSATKQPKCENVSHLFILRVTEEPSSAPRTASSPSAMSLLSAKKSLRCPWFWTTQQKSFCIKEMNVCVLCSRVKVLYIRVLPVSPRGYVVFIHVNALLDCISPQPPRGNRINKKKAMIESLLSTPHGFLEQERNEQLSCSLPATVLLMSW